jgi:GNAT superfamily N-acetyltransferase
VVQIRRAATGRELQAIYRFRYAVYVEEMGRKQRYADHENKLIRDPLDGEAGVCILGAWEGDEVVGTVRTNLLRCSNVGDYFGLYDLAAFPAEVLHNAALTTRMMVHPRHRNSLLATRIARKLYRYGLENAITTDLDCNRHLVGYYRRLGYVVHRGDVVPPEYGPVSVMRLNLTDLDHLESVRSPFAVILRARAGHRCRTTSHQG